MTQGLVIICDFAFWRSQVGSHTRVQNLIGELEGDFDVTVICIGHHNVEDQNIGIATTSVELIFIDGAVPDETDDDSGILSELRILLNALSPRAVILEYIRLSCLQSSIPSGTAVLLDTHDVMSQRSMSFLRHRRTPTIYRTAADEAAELARFDAVLAISSADAAYMRTVLGLANVITTPLSQSKHLASCVSRTKKPLGSRLTALFIGGANEPNERGLTAIARIWPALVDSYDLKVVGLVNANSVRRLTGVQVVGPVEDLADVYSGADVALNPVYMGGGLKIKVLEALSAGLPCVSSIEGARGFEQATEQGALLVADSLLSFVGHLSRLRDPNMRQVVGAAALSYAADRLNSEQAFGSLKQYLRHI